MHLNALEELSRNCMAWAQRRLGNAPLHMQMVLAGHPSKNIAADLHISQRTVANRRVSIMKRTGARSLHEARLAVAVDWSNPRGSVYAMQGTESAALFFADVAHN
jgi:RecB family endonuclease NucS